MKRLAAPPRTQGHPFNIHALKDGTLVCTYSGRRAGNPQEFTASSGVFVSLNSGTSWLDRSDPNMEYWTTDVVLDPNDAAQNTWYAGVYTVGAAHPMDWAASIKQQTAAFPDPLNNDDGVSSCAFNPLNTNELYVTTETEGLLFSGNITSARPNFDASIKLSFRPARAGFSSTLTTPQCVGDEFWKRHPHRQHDLPARMPSLTAPQKTERRLLACNKPLQAVYSILKSTNLTDWTSLGTNAGPNGVLQFNDPTATDSRRFYKSHAFEKSEAESRTGDVDAQKSGRFPGRAATSRTVSVSTAPDLATYRLRSQSGIRPRIARNFSPLAQVIRSLDVIGYARFRRKPGERDLKIIRPCTLAVADVSETLVFQKFSRLIKADGVLVGAGWPA